MTTIPAAFIHALGWALTHSLWQGALAAIALLVLLPRLQTARHRYQAAYGSLVAVLCLAVSTFIWKYEPVQADQHGSDTPLTDTSASSEFWIQSPFFNAGFGETFSQWLEQHNAFIVGLWLIGFVFFLLRLGGGLWQLHRLRTLGTRTLDAVWQDKINVLRHRIGVPRTVNLFESVWVNAPITLGWLKPAILLPVGFVNQLTVAEVEAVLAHELAHISRRDWVFNLLQAFIESLFYYHPAVWWISQVVRRERENACDDTALAVTGNPIAFARALVQVQEMATSAPKLALALSDKRRRPLLDRVRRILNQVPPQQQHQVMEKITATVILVALLALVGLRANSVPSFKAAFAQITDFPATIFEEQSAEDPWVSDSLPVPKSNRKITREDENGRVEAEFKNGELKRLNIDGREVPASDFAQHQALIENLEADVPPPPPPAPAPPPFGNAPMHHGWEMPAPPASPDAPGGFWFHAPEFQGIAPMPPFPPMPPFGAGISILTDKDGEGNTILKLENHGSSTELLIKDGEVWLDGKPLPKGEPLDIPGFNFEGDGRHFFSGDGSHFWGEGNFFAPEASSEELKKAREELEKAMEEHQRNFERAFRQSEKALKETHKAMEKDRKVMEKQQKVMLKEHQKMEVEHRVLEAKSNATQERLKRELLRDGLIQDPENFSLKLNSKVLKINNKKQSEAMRRKYEELVRSVSGINTEGDKWNFLVNYPGEN